jgi:hypothetical protein
LTNFTLVLFFQLFLIAPVIASQTFNFMQFYPYQTQLLAPKFSAIFILPLVFDLCTWTLNWLSHIQFSLIWPMIWSISAPTITRLFQLGLWFWISSMKSLIIHQTLIFMQLSPWFDQINSLKLQINPQTLISSN